MLHTTRRPGQLAALVACVIFVAPLRVASAHCDKVDGPVVSDARRALKARRVEMVFKWISASQEAQVRTTFKHALQVRALGNRARRLADRHFFETVVRLHRASEGAPYTGLKPASAKLEPSVKAADRALAHGSVKGLSKAITRHASRAIARRFARVVKLRRMADRSAVDGRRYVAAYVDYVHFVRRLHLAVAGKVHKH